MKPDCTKVFAMDGRHIGDAYGPTVDCVRWYEITRLVRDFYRLEADDELEILEIPSGPLEGAEIVVNERGDWLACFDFEVAFLDRREAAE